MGTDLPLARSRLLFWYCIGTRASGCHTGIQLLLLLDTNALFLVRPCTVEPNIAGSRQILGVEATCYDCWRAMYGFQIDWRAWNEHVCDWRSAVPLFSVAHAWYCSTAWQVWLEQRHGDNPSHPLLRRLWERRKGSDEWSSPRQGGRSLLPPMAFMASDARGTSGPLLGGVA